MGKDHKGQPSGTNKSEGTGLRPELPEEKLEQDQEITRKYVDEEKDELKDNVRELNPNRNPDKEDATNAGGYRQ